MSGGQSIAFHRSHYLARCACAVAAMVFVHGRAGAVEFFTNGFIPSLKIELNTEAQAVLRKDAREFVRATVREAGGTYSNVAVRLKGKVGSWRPLDDKPALTLDFCCFEAGQKFHGLRRIHLNNSVEDPGYINEKLGSEIFAAAGVPSPRVTRALVELNGRALGLYVLKEGFTEDFLATHFQKISGELYEAGVGHDVGEELERDSVSAPFDQDQRALAQLAAAAAEKDLATRWGRLNKTLDMNRFLKFMALEVMLGHRDGYCLARNNFRVYHDLDSGRMVFLPHGMDQLFGTPDLPWQPQLAGVVARAVMETPEGSQGYATVFRALLTNVFVVERLTNRVDQLVGEVRPVLGRREFAAMKVEADALKARIALRKQSLLEQTSRPTQKPIEFANGVALIGEWKISGAANATLDQQKLEGGAVLHISARADCSASWRTTVLLPRGSYRFEGRVKALGVQPLVSGLRQGACLRVVGGMASKSLVGDAQWRGLSAEFEIGVPAQEVELVCELRASQGEAWFDLESLKLVSLENL